ncbi:GNAT family N-acetyltransferase [Citricoccus muralis]|uniref:GNAT family N-acetyltransferase n=1 Tax=Citricoccus muralis TaxID=169134 RepID=A0ABY8H3V8_9MICC|nr:GNAT family N-acetyltransferase [Citricoccus muralis]WFP15804.1 GNAT family N-acetyltransferase [Citricoccus muralis]
MTDLPDTHTADSPELPEGFRLRRLHADDVDTLLVLERTLFPEDAWPEQFFLEELEQAGPAEQGGTRDYRVLERRAPTETNNPAHDQQWSIVGYAGLMSVPPLADVQTIGVHPDYEGLGLGSALLRWMVAEAGRRGAEDLLLEVRADNHRAQRLYARHGFDHIHTRSGYYPQGIDAKIMRRHLHTGPCRWD